MCRKEEVAEVFDAPFMDLIYNAAYVHRMHNDPSMVRFSVDFAKQSSCLCVQLPIFPVFADIENSSRENSSVSLGKHEA